MASSTNPSTGIKSGMKSIGLKAYPTVIIATSFAYHGVSSCLYAR